MTHPRTWIFAGVLALAAPTFAVAPVGCGSTESHPNQSTVGGFDAHAEQGTSQGQGDAAVESATKTDATGAAEAATGTQADALPVEADAADAASDSDAGACLTVCSSAQPCPLGQACCYPLPGAGTCSYCASACPAAGH
jgi:hypothetical protein